jgi:hypothetical protein
VAQLEVLLVFSIFFIRKCRRRRWPLFISSGFIFRNGFPDCSKLDEIAALCKVYTRVKGALGMVKAIFVERRNLRDMTF